jgi:hypothetical protein
LIYFKKLGIKEVIKMKKAIRVFFVLIVVLLSIWVCLAQGQPSPKTHFYIIEFKKPVIGGVATLNVIFFDDVQPKGVETFLKLEIEKLKKLFPISFDILATGWSSLGDASTERIIKLSDGSNNLIYQFKKNQILTYKEAYGDDILPSLKKR